MRDHILGHLGLDKRGGVGRATYALKMAGWQPVVGGKT